MKRNSKFGFTLVEVLTGIVVLGVISTCSWYAASTLFRGEQLNRNRTVAINLLQKSQEELRKASLSFYDSMETCQFPGPAFNATNNTCGLQVLAAPFNGYDRNAVITPEHSSTEIKKAVITVNWTDQGNAKSMNSAVLLARPPDPLPGNIYGTVRSSGPGNNLINGAQITATLVGNTSSRTTTSKNFLGTKGENYDFFDSSTGAFVLPVGTWRITATHPSYYAYPGAGNVDVTVTSNGETPHPFEMDPKPQNATVNIRLVDATNGNAQIPNFESGYIFLLDDFEPTHQIIQHIQSSSFLAATVTFNNTNPKSFTIVNNWAYLSGYAAKTNSLGPPSCVYNYQRHGWSSSVQQADGTLICANPFNGSNATDRILVNPGDTINITAPLFPVPTATINGKVVDKNGVGLDRALLYARWPNEGIGERWWRKNGSYISTLTDAAGKYTFVVPAAQEMFSNNAAGGLTIRAEHNMPFNACCDSPQQTLVYAYSSPVTNLFAGSTISIPDITISDAGNSDCGNVKGNIKDGLSGLNLNGAAINVQGVGNNTAGAGNYIYQCPAAGYRLPTGQSRFFSTLGGYYNYDNAGNWWYAAAPNVNIASNAMVNYDGKLWPVGYGTLVVNVRETGSNLPINGASVTFGTYCCGSQTLSTGADGKATFNNALETWPPADLPGDPYYSHVARGHSVSATDPSGFHQGSSKAIPILRKNVILEELLYLDPSGGT